MSNIDPRKFITSGTDSKGHSTTVSCRVQPLVDHQLELIAHRSEFPYRGQKSAVIRHAIHMYLEYIETQAPVPSIIHQVDVISMIMAEEEYNAEFHRTIDRLSDLVASRLSTDDRGQARTLIARVMGQVEQMAEGPWKERYEGEMRRRFGHLLDGASVPLVEGKE